MKQATKSQPTARALAAVRRFRLAYGDYEAHIFGQFLRQKRRHWSRSYRAAFTRAYIATKSDPWPTIQDVLRDRRAA